MAFLPLPFISTHHRVSAAHRTQTVPGPVYALGPPLAGLFKRPRLSDPSSNSIEAILLSSGSSAHLQEKCVWKVAVFPVVKKDHV